MAGTRPLASQWISANWSSRMGMGVAVGAIGSSVPLASRGPEPECPTRETARPMPGFPQPPRAPRRPTELRHGRDVRVDDWHWLRDRDDPAVRELLEAENTYLDAMLAPLEKLRADVFAEIKARVVETDVSAPVRRGRFEYFTRTRAGLEYPVHCRRPVGTSALPDPDASPGVGDEQDLLDENVLAEGAEYLALRGVALSPDQGLLAYSVDRTGGERARLQVRDRATGGGPPAEVPRTDYALRSANGRRRAIQPRA